MMDWHAEDKSVAWEHFTTLMKLYYTVAHTKEEAKVDIILFFGLAHSKENMTLKWTLQCHQYSM